MPITNSAPAVGSNWDVDQEPAPEAESPAGRRRRQNVVIAAVVVAFVVVTGVAALALESRNHSTAPTTTDADAAPAVSLPIETDESRAVRLQAGAALAANGALRLSPDAVELLRTGQVDERLLNVLATLAAQHDLQVADFPAVAGEEGVGAPRRTVEIDSIDFRPVTPGSADVETVTAFLDQQLDAYRPAAVEVEPRDGGNASLRITYSPHDSTNP